VSRSEAVAVFRAVRAAIRELDPLNLIRTGSPRDEYDSVSDRATRVLIDGGTEDEAARAMVDVFRADWGVTLAKRDQRVIAKALRAADPRLKRVRFPFLHRILHDRPGQDPHTVFEGSVEPAERPATASADEGSTCILCEEPALMAVAVTAPSDQDRLGSAVNLCGTCLGLARSGDSTGLRDRMTDGDAGSTKLIMTLIRVVAAEPATD
jgi:hypothetical protein